tara:strand:- start:1612 stop:2028 length:417 start_codon:yes stop_codon:yes gene_type:complete
VNIYSKRRSLPAVPIISLIDILAILLIFFIATTTFKQKKTMLNISLPKASKMSGAAVVERRMTISVTAEEEIWIEDELVALENLAPALIQLKQSEPDLKLELKADEELPLGLLVGVWDAFNQAGIAIKDVPARILLHK